MSRSIPGYVHLRYICVHLRFQSPLFMTLLPGDIITTGTPPGVGLGRWAMSLRSASKGSESSASG